MHLTNNRWSLFTGQKSAAVICTELVEVRERGYSLAGQRVQVRVSQEGGVRREVCREQRRAPRSHHGAWLHVQRVLRGAAPAHLTLAVLLRV